MSQVPISDHGGAAGRPSRSACRSPSASRRLRSGVASAVSAAMLVGALAGCSEGDQTAEKAASTTTSYAGFPEDIAAACAAYYEAQEEFIADTTPSEPEYGDSLEALAAEQAAGTRLEGPLREEAAAWRRGDYEIPPTVNELCLSSTTTTISPADAELRQRFLAEVRAAEPAITDSDAALLDSIEFVCDGIDLATGREGSENWPAHEDQLVGFAWAPLEEPDHAESVVRVGVPIFCPEHTDLVFDVLDS